MTDIMDLMKAARYANNNGDARKAKTIAQNIIADYPDSPAVLDAQKLLATLEGRKYQPRDNDTLPMTTKPVHSSSTESSRDVVVLDVRIPFSRMVAILVKISLAAIPAMIIVTAVVVFVWAFILSILQ